MNNIEEMPPKCHYCPYWELAKPPYYCPDCEDALNKPDRGQISGMMHTFIPNEIQCYWCNGQMNRGIAYSGSGLNHVTYFCRECGGVAHFAVNHEQKITAIDVEYKSSKPKPQ